MNFGTSCLMSRTWSYDIQVTISEEFLNLSSITDSPVELHLYESYSEQFAGYVELIPENGLTQLAPPSGSFKQELYDSFEEVDYSRKRGISNDDNSQFSNFRNKKRTTNSNVYDPNSFRQSIESPYVKNEFNSHSQNSWNFIGKEMEFGQSNLNYQLTSNQLNSGNDDSNVENGKFLCDLCPTTATRRFSLKKHYMTVHNLPERAAKAMLD